MLSRAIDIAGGKQDASYAVAELVALGVDERGVKVFERERDAALKRRHPVREFVTVPMYLHTMADMAQLDEPQAAQFEALLADRTRSYNETGQ